MAATAAAQAELCRLRRDIARIEGRLAEADRLVLDRAPVPAGLGPSVRAAGLRPYERQGRLRLGLPPLDAILAGGLPLSTLHEVRAGESRDGAAAAGFVLALAAHLAAAGGPPSIVWIGEADARREAGKLYAPGLAALGLDPASVVEVAARTENEALWAFEAALACRGVGLAVCELRRASLGLAATRRCVLRARATGVTGFLLRLGSEAEPSAAELRFALSPAPAGAIGRHAAGVGRMAWCVAIEKNRGGRTGAVTVEWNAHDRSFAERGGENRRANPQPLPAAPLNRPPHPVPAARLGLRRAS